MSIVAKVDVTLRINSGSSWGEDCDIKQIRKQALDGVRGKLGNLLKDHPDIQIIGYTKVTALEYDLGELK